MSFEVRFWGVRGSIACASSQYTVYGGNTSCVEVRVDDRVIILDAGTGIRELGKKIMADNITNATLMFTHTHWDHINGFPFFVPAYIPTHSFKVLAGHLKDRRGSIRHTLSSQMVGPMFPIPLEAMQADLQFEDFSAGETFKLYPDVTVRTSALNHPNEATGYRIEHNGRSVCYITDTEHKQDKPDEKILRLIDGADVVIYDSTYTEEEYPTKVGWGHSTWNEGMRLCQFANVKKFVVFHHDPDHDDTRMAEIELDVTRAWDQTTVAREGMIIDLEAEFGGTV
jgi:phosphoribosyl 1,2-cyclic phosphodiesterase